MGDPRADRPCGLDQRRLRPDGAAGTDAEERDRDEGAQVADVLGAARHVDVVDQQLDVARAAEEQGEPADGGTDEGEDEEVRPVAEVLRAEQPLHDVEQPDVGGGDEPGCDADHDHEPQQAPLRIHIVA